ncbi:MAG: TetR/AcrR family transcriptional regulator [Terriglobales bacterium]
MSAKPKPARQRAEQTRALILQAAIREFAAEGVAGARTDAIARQAKVNKALLYYYFKDKETLYGAALDFVFSGLTQRVSAVLRAEAAPGEKILRFVGAHFDYIASNPDFPRMVQWEMTRAGRAGSPHIRRIVQNYFRPAFRGLREIFRQAIERGEVRAVDPAQVIPSLIAMNIFYFSSAPLLRLLLPGDPLSPERIAERRAAVLDFVSSALLTPSAKPGRSRKEAGR